MQWAGEEYGYPLLKQDGKCTTHNSELSNFQLNCAIENVQNLPLFYLRKSMISFIYGNEIHLALSITFDQYRGKMPLERQRAQMMISETLDLSNLQTTIFSYFTSSSRHSDSPNTCMSETVRTVDRLARCRSLIKHNMEKKTALLIFSYSIFHNSASSFYFRHPFLSAGFPHIPYSKAEYSSVVHVYRI